MTDEEIFSDLTRRLSASATIHLEKGAIEISSFDGTQLEPAVRLLGTSESLVAHVRGMADDARGAFLETEPLIAALQLFLVHVEESILTRKPGENELVPGPAGLRWLP